MNFIKKLILWIIASWASVYITAHYFPSFLVFWWWIKALLMTWVVFGLLNSILKPILKLVSLPLIIITLWLFDCIINAFVIYFMEWFINKMPSLWIVFEVKWWFFSYVVIAIVLSIINYLTHWLIDIKD